MDLSRQLLLISHANKVKRLEWARQYKDDVYSDNVVWTDESTVQLETRHRFCLLKKRRATKEQTKELVSVHNVNSR